MGGGGVKSWEDMARNTLLSRTTTTANVYSVINSTLGTGTTRLRRPLYSLRPPPTTVSRRRLASVCGQMFLFFVSKLSEYIYFCKCMPI